MFRPFAALLASFIILSACGSNMRSKDKVQDAILARLQSHSGLDLKSLDVTTTNVSFEKNLAYATVAFHPKGDPSVNSGMVMKYTLEDRDGKWVVTKVGDSQGHSLGGRMPGAGTVLPPGHTSLDQVPHSEPPVHTLHAPPGNEPHSEKAQ